MRVAVPTPADVARLGAAIDDVEFVAWNLADAAPAEAFDVVVPPFMAPAATLAALGTVDVALVQMQSLGFDGVEAAVGDATWIANAAGAHEDATAELTLALILSANRLLPTFGAQQAAGEWRKATAPGLNGRRVLIVGAGGVANAVARRLTPFGVAVTRVARTARRDDLGDVLAGDRLDTEWGAHDVVVLAVPGTPETRHLVDAGRLARLHDGALLVNIARGPVVDTDALVDELRTGRIRAALDVVDPEPLPSGHPLWSLPNVQLTPHVGGAIETMQSSIDSVLVAQLHAVRAGDDPINIVRRGGRRLQIAARAHA